MTTTMLFAIGAALLTVLAVLTLLLALRTLLSRDDAIITRLGTYLGVREPLDVIEMGPAEPRFARQLNEAINRQSFAERIAHDLGQANLPLTVPEYLLIRAAVPLLLALVALFVWRTVLMLPVALLVGAILPVFWLRLRRRRRNRDFNDQLAEMITMIASSMRAGFSLIQSVTHASKETLEPTKSELRRVAQEVQLGLSINQALDNLVARMESDDLDLVVTAIKIHARVGGNLTIILENISTTIRERAKLRREIRVITSMQRLSSYVIGLLPVVLALIIFSINPQYMLRLFQPGWTLCIPFGAAISSVLGFIVIQRIVDIKI
jgi:tight adherence protein B